MATTQEHLYEVISGSDDDVDRERLIQMRLHNNNELNNDINNNNNNDMNINNNNINGNNSGSNIIMTIITVIIAGISSLLNELPITSRYIHKFLILNFILTFIGFLTKFMTLNYFDIFESYQIWRIFTYFYCDTSVFLGLFGCVILSDIIKRFEYNYGSIWTLYLFMIHALFMGFITFMFQFILYSIFFKDYINSNNIDINNIDIKNKDNNYSWIFIHLLYNNVCVGLYPMIFSLLIIESNINNPNQIFPFIFNNFYISSKYHAYLYVLIFTIFRIDLGIYIIILLTTIMSKIIPSIYHLSYKNLQKLEKSRLIKYIILYIIISHMQ